MWWLKEEYRAEKSIQLLKDRLLTFLRFVAHFILTLVDQAFCAFWNFAKS